jgi:hypothetical protein
MKCTAGTSIIVGAGCHGITVRFWSLVVSGAFNVGEDQMLPDRPYSNVRLQSRRKGLAWFFHCRVYDMPMDLELVRHVLVLDYAIRRTLLSTVGPSKQGRERTQA